MERYDSPHFPLVRSTRQHVVDDVQAALVAECERCFDALWPSGKRPPAALLDLFVVVDQLVDYTSRSPAGRAHMKKRLLKMIAANMEEPWYEPNDLLANQTALVTVPGIMATLVRQERQELEEIETAALVEEVCAWLQSGT